MRDRREIPSGTVRPRRCRFRFRLCRSAKRKNQSIAYIQEVICVQIKSHIGGTSRKPSRFRYVMLILARRKSQEPGQPARGNAQRAYAAAGVRADRGIAGKSRNSRRHPAGKSRNPRSWTGQAAAAAASADSCEAFVLASIAATISRAEACGVEAWTSATASFVLMPAGSCAMSVETSLKRHSDVPAVDWASSRRVIHVWAKGHLNPGLYVSPQSGGPAALGAGRRPLMT